MSGYHCRHCGRLCNEFKHCDCPESKGEAAAHQAILNSIIVRYTITLIRKDNSCAEVFPDHTRDWGVAMSFARERLLNTMQCHAEYSRAIIEGELGVKWALEVNK